MYIKCFALSGEDVEEIFEEMLRLRNYTFSRVYCDVNGKHIFCNHDDDLDTLKEKYARKS